MAIKKAVIQFVVLFDDKEVNPSFIEDGPLGDIEAEANEGALLGQSTLMSMEDVKPEDLQNEMEALGNDGMFFSLDDDSAPSP